MIVLYWIAKIALWILVARIFIFFGTKIWPDDKDNFNNRTY